MYESVVVMFERELRSRREKGEEKEGTTGCRR
jgi:hypothetical protein